jgi:hypothetical protein
MTLLIDRGGKIAASHTGVVDKEDCSSDPRLTPGGATLGFRPRVTGARTDQLAGGILLDRVRDPAHRSAQGEQD